MEPITLTVTALYTFIRCLISVSILATHVCKHIHLLSH